MKCENCGSKIWESVHIEDSPYCEECALEYDEAHEEAEEIVNDLLNFNKGEKDGD